jgi:hypothetical protein
MRRSMVAREWGVPKNNDQHNPPLETSTPDKRACRYRTITLVDWPETGFEEVWPDWYRGVGVERSNLERDHCGGLAYFLRPEK